MALKILNGYCGIGGNRKLWTGDIEVTAVEIDPGIAAIYKKLFPQDHVVVGDAHEYLLKHYKEFDFIWLSPPCPTHSRLQFPRIAKGNFVYPDMKLYQEIILLQTVFKGKWIVENVISFYDPLLKPTLIGRHYYWSNYPLGKPNWKINDDIANGTVAEMAKYHDIHLPEKTKNHRLLLRNAVNPEHGKYLFDMAFKNKQTLLI